MKKFLLAVLLLIMLIAGTLGYFIIRSFNADNFQKQVVQGVSDLTGRTLTIQGATSVSWFPIPTIVLHKVALTNHTDSPRAIMLQADTVSVQIDWQSMLSSPLEIKQIDIEKPTIYLEKLANGSRNWTFPFFMAPDKTVDPGLMGAASDTQMKINVIRVSDGVVEFVDSSRNLMFMANELSGDIKIDTVKGPYTFKGTAEINKNKFSFSSRLNRFALGSPTKFSADINSSASGFQLNLEGEITPENLDLDLTANGTFNVKKPAQLLAAFQSELPDASLDVATDGSFGIELRPDQDVVKNFVIRFGNGENAPTVTGEFTRNRVTNKFSYSGSVAMNVLDGALAKRVLQKFGVNPFNPASVPEMDMTVNVQKMPFEKSAISDFKTVFKTKAGQVTVSEFHAVLPGNTVVDATAESIVAEEKTGYEIALKSQTDNLRALLPFVPHLEKMPPEGTMQKASFDGHLTVFPNGMQAEIDTAQIDHTSVNGIVAIEQGEKLPLLVLNLTASNLNTDTYFGYQATETKENFTNAVLAAQQYFKENKSLVSLDSIFDINVTDLTFRSLPVGHLHAKGTLANGTLKLIAMEVTDMATAQFQASGAIEGIGTDDVRIADGELNFSADQLPLFLQRANIDPSFQFVQITPGMAFRTEVALAGGTWDLTTQGRIGDLSGRFTGKITPTDGMAVYRDFSFDIAHSDFQQLMTHALPSVHVNKGLIGSFKLKGILNGTAQDFQISDGALSVGTQHVTGDVKLKKGKRYELTADLKADSFDGQKMIPEFLKQAMIFDPMSTKPFDFSALDDWDIALTLATEQLLYGTADLKKTNLNLTVKDKALTIHDLSGQQQNNDVSPFNATVSFNWVETPIFKMAAELTKVPLRPDFLMIDTRAFGNGAATIKLDVAGTGADPAALFKSLKGEGAFTLDNTQFVGAELGAVPALVQTGLQKRLDDVAFKTQMGRLLTMGRTSFPQITGTFTVTEGMVRSVDTKMGNDSFVSDPIQFTWAIPAETLDIFMPVSLPQYPDLPPFALTAKGTLDKMAYQENATDLSAAVNAEVSAVLSKEQTQKEEAKAEQQEQELSDRRSRIKQAVESANKAVKDAADKIYGDTQSEASYLLQNAKDALRVMNELAIKENPTDAQYIQLMEQSRLAILRANESVDEMRKDAYFDERNQLLVYQQRGREIVNYIKALHTERPDIELVARLLPATMTTQTDLEAVAKAALGDITPEENERLAKEAASLFGQLQRAYDYVQRFQVGEPIVPVADMPKISDVAPAATAEDLDTVADTKPVKGLISR